MKAAAMMQACEITPTDNTTIDDNRAKAQRVRELNDSFRRAPWSSGRVVLTAGVSALDPAEQLAIVQQVREFEAFNDNNDPWREHDFGAFEHGGAKFFWKIDYYSRDLKHGSPDPADPAVTCRVLTVMLASEY